ncbi:uncharacterized protein F4812DRAFT_450063 [Daldinia caldariorum]|uniref:uncharacterized protein n=1 Tax=Daldinia caldariorum TaxID=326644 RepID=UPI00200835D1|nr:uncharacterized protein F4812DRAFT_450063 [Daldinia caldariorum]KAI1470849.1 hypothetical protein F4812DRAFT_450063 [Daldinia caldariorum]
MSLDPRSKGGNNNNNRSSCNNCRCFPGDACWPTLAEWSSFNDTVGGRLVATVPIAAPCHQSDLADYDAQACRALRDVWWYPNTHLATSSSPMAPFFANASCDPFTAPDDQCVVGAYVRYAVRAIGVSDYQATLAFAAARNIRLVVRNTGHDYFGKSTGAGALALWTHFLNDTQLIDNYTSPAYAGKALKLGAGTGALEAYRAADEAGVAVVGGACDTVGLAGGYSQGADHGPLNSVFRLGTDQVLDPTQNSDLYWALSGGGGGTYAAILSMTVRAHRLTKVSAASLSFTTGANVTADLFNSAVHAFLLTHPSLAEAGAWSTWLLATGVFSLVPVVGPNLDKDQLQTLFEPTISFLDSNGIPYDYEIRQYNTFLEAYTGMFPFCNITEYNIGRVISGNSFDVSGFPSTGIQNSVNPVWRTAILNLVIGLAYDTYDFQANVALQTKMTNTIMPRLEALTPGGGTYLNEADFRDPDWKNNFYRTNYAKLLSIKDKYDPDSLFYGPTAVGSDRWTAQPDGRLCRAS